MLADYSRHRRALQIGANGQGARVELLQFSDGGIDIELTDVNRPTLAFGDPSPQQVG